MGRCVFYVFLMGHLLGDFYFQSDELANKKKTSIKELLKHSFIYFIVMICVSIVVFHYNIVKWAIMLSVIHFGIDFLKCMIDHKKHDINETQIYIIDQLLHIGTIFLVVCAMIWNHEIISLQPILTYFKVVPTDLTFILSWLLMLCIILIPASVTIKITLRKFQPENKHKEKGKPSAGALIGMLERVFIAMMLSVGQYSAIGFVLTAKSIARYKKIIDDPEFSEYYLLGTLLSSIIVIASYYFIF